MSYVNIDQLRERIALLSIHSQAGADGREIRTYHMRGYAWANITSYLRFERLATALTAETRPTLTPVYKIVVRSVPSDEPLRTIRAIQWKGRIFELIEPFAPHAHVPNYLQALCTETKLKGSVDLEGKESRDSDTGDHFSPLSEDFLEKSEKGGCQRRQNVDSMKYKKDQLIKINSKQNVNIKKDDDLREQPVKNQETQGDIRGQGSKDRKGDDHAEN